MDSYYIKTVAKLSDCGILVETYLLVLILKINIKCHIISSIGSYDIRQTDIKTSNQAIPICSLEVIYLLRGTQIYIINRFL